MGWHGWRVSWEEREALVSVQRQNKDQVRTLDEYAGFGALRGIIGFLYIGAHSCLHLSMPRVTFAPVFSTGTC